MVKSPLLERTLQLYLREYLVNFDECDFVITDNIDESFNKPICLIDFNENADILRPIYKEGLMCDLGRFGAKLREMRHCENVGKNVLDFGELSRLKQSIELINSNKSRDGSPNGDSKDQDIKAKIDAIVRDFTNRLYEEIKNIR